MFVLSPPTTCLENFCSKEQEIQRLGTETKDTCATVSQLNIEVVGGMATLTEQIKGLTSVIEKLDVKVSRNDDSLAFLSLGVAGLKSMVVSKDNCVEIHKTLTESLTPTIDKVKKHDIYFVLMGAVLVILLAWVSANIHIPFTH